jgi:hypothetical protein
MRSATALGRDMGTVCDVPSSSVVVAPARLAPKRATSGLIAWSAVDASVQEGLGEVLRAASFSRIVRVDQVSATCRL